LVFYAKGFWGMHEESASAGETDQGGTWHPNITKKRATYKIAPKQGDVPELGQFIVPQPHSHKQGISSAVVFG